MAHAASEKLVIGVPGAVFEDAWQHDGKKLRNIMDYVRVEVIDRLHKFKKHSSVQKAIEHDQVADVADFVRLVSEDIAALLTSEIYVISKERKISIDNDHIDHITDTAMTEFLCGESGKFSIQELQKTVRKLIAQSIQKEPALFESLYSTSHAHIVQDRETRHKTRGMMQDARLGYQFHCAKDRSADVVTDEQERLKYAKVLHKRHKTLNKAVKIARAIIAFERGDKGPLQEVREDILKNGALIEMHDASFFQEMAENPYYLIARGKGRPPKRPLNMDHIEYIEEAKDGADIEVLLPSPPGQVSGPVVPLPHESNDEFFAGRKMAQTIREHPFTAGLIMDTAVDPDCAAAGLMSKARDVLFDHIREKYPYVNALVGEIFEITGVTVKEHETITIDYPLTNPLSMLVNAQAAGYKNRAVLGWKRLNKQVPVRMPDGRVVMIETNWYGMIHPLR